MWLGKSQLLALLCLVLVIQVAAADSFRIVKRRDDGHALRAVERDGKSQPTKTNKPTKTATAKDSHATKTEKGSKHRAKSTATQTTGNDGGPQSTSIVTNGDLSNSTLVNVTIPKGTLPIEPKITPGWGVAGTVMLLTGITHGLIGIKNRWLHTFFSTAFSAALGVAVLIIYVMSVPVSKGVQGGYVVACIVSGCALGGAATFFREITEGLGCALGGFSVSMWLLTLVPGGLLTSVAAKAIFISCFTLVGFAFYFSRWTRDWALILMISFSGATVTVLGIDCFSRAGLKEFWAYVWHLNSDLFPDGVDTYPVTKGIRVESAATIIFCLIAVISQIKLWKIIREQRQKKAEELAEEQRNLEQEEENVGRNIEHMHARERRQWERIYGDGEAGSSTESRLSENGDGTSEKQMRSSHTGSTQQGEGIEMSDIAESENHRNPVQLMASEQDKEGRVTVRVASDDMPRELSDQDSNEKAAIASSDGQTLAAVGTESRRVSQNSQGLQPPPTVVPLPFNIPVVDEMRSNADRSSVATFADEENDQARVPGQRHSFVKRLSHLSHESADLIRSISQRSGRTHGNALEHHESTEGLVIPARNGDDDGSLAATVDDESLSGGDRHSIPPRDIEITAELSDTGMPRTPQTEQGKITDADGKSTANQSRAEQNDQNAAEDQGKSKSVTSGVSVPVSLTQDRLPRSLSRVALSYRTNEWAKHLSNADAPELDVIEVNDQAVEAPVPVHMDELRKGAADGAPPPAVARSDSQASNVSHGLSRRGSRQNVPTTLAILNGEGQTTGTGITQSSSGLPRVVSSGFRRTSAGIEPIAEEHASVRGQDIGDGAIQRQNSLSPIIGVDARSPTPGVVSYSSPQTLIGQREVFLRNKSQGNLLASASEMNLNRASSDAGSMHNYPMYAAAVGADIDDLPLSQRKQLMHNSVMNSASTPALGRMAASPEVGSGDFAFDSHQPQRNSNVPTPAARQMALANFRESVQKDLRAGAPVVKNSGRETPFAPMSLLAGREAEVQRNIEMGRNILMGQKEAEAQRREREYRDRELADRAFDERMRSGDMLDIHREAMRKMQRNAHK